MLLVVLIGLVLVIGYEGFVIQSLAKEKLAQGVTLETYKGLFLHSQNVEFQAKHPIPSYIEACDDDDDPTEVGEVLEAS